MAFIPKSAVPSTYRPPQRGNPRHWVLIESKVGSGICAVRGCTFPRQVWKRPGRGAPPWFCVGCRRARDLANMAKWREDHPGYWMMWKNNHPEVGKKRAEQKSAYRRRSAAKAANRSTNNDVK